MRRHLPPPPLPLPVPATFRLASPTSVTGKAALAIIHLDGDIDAALAALRIAPIATGHARLRTIQDVDTLVVTRPAPRSALLFPHAGPAVVRRLEAALIAAGCTPAADDGAQPHRLSPSGLDDLDARLAHALARTASPLAINLLLAQPARLAAAAGNPARLLPPADAALLRRLIDPPLVVALGPPNIGKSSLLNALAGRGVSIVANEPGTTRDHVGARLDLAGLVVRYVDTPGIHPTGDTPEGGILAQAQAAATLIAAEADLVLLCCDPTAPAIASPPGVESLRVGLRSDLGPPRGPVDTIVSVRTSEGIVELVAHIRERLVPARVLNDPRAWDF